MSALKFTLLVLVVGLIAKDTSQLNDPYIIRGLAQGLCLVVGGIWLLSNFSSQLFPRYWPVWGYLAALTLSAGWLGSPVYVWLQIASLAAVLLFFVAYFEARAALEDGGVGYLLDVVVLLYGLVAALSLMVKFTHPGIAYDVLYIGDVGMESRFRGLFPKAGMLASAAGLTFGLAWFARCGVLLKGCIMVVCGVCQALTLSRASWIALAVAVFAVYWTTLRTGKKLKATGFGLAAVIALWLGITAFDVTFDLSNARFLRAESITNLTGRVGLWEESMEAFYRRPLLGYGYTAGASGLKSASGDSTGDSFEMTRDVGKTTLHSGYMQSLLDTGLAGTSFYLALLAVALKRLWQRPLNTARDRAVLFGIVYLAVANASQNVIYTASVFDSVMFFGLAIYAMRPQQLARPTAHTGPAYPRDSHGRSRAVMP